MENIIQESSILSLQKQQAKLINTENQIKELEKQREIKNKKIQEISQSQEFIIIIFLDMIGLNLIEFGI